MGRNCWPGTRRSRSSGPIAPSRPALKLAEWTVKAAEVQVANGTAGPDLRARLVALKDQAPHLAPAIRKVEDAQDWRGTTSDGRGSVRGVRSRRDEPEKPLAAVQAFLRDFPDTPHRAEALALLDTFKAEAAARQASSSGRASTT